MIKMEKVWLEYDPKVSSPGYAPYCVRYVGMRGETRPFGDRLWGDYRNEMEKDYETRQTA